MLLTTLAVFNSDKNYTPEIADASIDIIDDHQTHVEAILKLHMQQRNAEECYGGISLQFPIKIVPMNDQNEVTFEVTIDEFMFSDHFKLMDESASRFTLADNVDWCDEVDNTFFHWECIESFLNDQKGIFLADLVHAK